jgi:hypothetical protein
MPEREDGRPRHAAHAADGAEGDDFSEGSLHESHFRFV